MLAESRNRVLRLFEAGEPPTAEVVAAVEADVALAVTVLRLANQVDGRHHGRVESAVRGRRGAVAADRSRDRQPRPDV